MNGCDLFLKFNGWSCFAFLSSQRKFSPINRWLHTHKEGEEKFYERKKKYSHIPSLDSHNTKTLNLINLKTSRHRGKPKEKLLLTLICFLSHRQLHLQLSSTNLISLSFSSANTHLHHRHLGRPPPFKTKQAIVFTSTVKHDLYHRLLLYFHDSPFLIANFPLPAIAEQPPHTEKKTLTS